MGHIRNVSTRAIPQLLRDPTLLNDPDVRAAILAALKDDAMRQDVLDALLKDPVARRNIVRRMSNDAEMRTAVLAAVEKDIRADARAKLRQEIADEEAAERIRIADEETAQIKRQAEENAAQDVCRRQIPSFW